MKHSHKKSFDWYSMHQRYSIRKYHFGAASVLLGTALVLGAAANAQTVQAEEQNPEVTNIISVDKVEEATKPVEVSTPKKETTYAAPTVAHPVETTSAKTEEATKLAEASTPKKETTYTAPTVAHPVETTPVKTEEATKPAEKVEEAKDKSANIGLEPRSNSDKGTVLETPVGKKADVVEAKEESKPAATTSDRSAVDSAVLPTSTTAKVEATNEILKPGLSLSDARQNPAIRKEDLDKGHSGFRAASNPANPIVSGSGNTVAFSDISQAGRSYSFRGYGNSRGGNSIHYDVTTVRQGNKLNFTIDYSGPGEFVNNNFILDKGDGFGNPSNATITTPRLREQSKPVSQGANYVAHSAYSMTSATSTSEKQTIRFSLPINNPNGDLSVRLKPVTFNVNQGGGSAATSNDPYSNSNYYFREKPLLLDANPNGGTNNKTETEEIDFQTVYLPTSKLPEGQTKLVREGEKGQRQITYKVHRFGNETILGLPISNRVTKEAKPRIVQIGVAKELIDTVKPRVDQNKVGDTNNLTFYLDNDGNGVYTEGVDELVQKIAIKDGAKGEKGDQGERGLTGAKGEKGDRGERGLTGAKGEKGDRGERGLTGAKGEKGDQGERGLTGAKGEKGDQGERGLIGAKGEKGDRGERGLTGAKGEKGDQGERGLTGAQGRAGRDGVTPTVTVRDNKEEGTHTITINDGRGNVTNTVVRDGLDGASPLVSTQRNEADKTTTVIFYYDKNGNNELDASDKKLKEVVIADGAKGEKGDQGERGLTGAQGEKGERGDRGETGAAGRDGKTPKITTARGADGRSTDITFTIPGEEPVTVNVKDGKDGRTPNIDLNALAEAAVRLNNQRSGRVRRALSDTPAPTEKPKVIGTRITAYFDNNGNGKYDPGVDEPISSADILNGTDGANGAAGADGADGRNGAELLSGPKAPTADDGKDGDTYIDATTGDVYKKENGTWDKIGNIRGPQGLKGEDGVAGPQGPKGDKGAEGAQGPKGADGAQGLPGRDGRDGRDGKDVLNGKVDPTTEGKDGDKYVNTETGDVFVKNNGTWEKEGNIKGPKGDKGAEGAQGPKGADGAQGLPGRDGRDGAAGRDGRDGRDGKDVLNGKVDPTTEGKDGDKYVNTETGDVFVKNNGNWEKEGNIKGPKGDKGEQGLQGR
ncbi:G5 domain-containing protein, partial [Streptococcus vestibularis]